MSATKQVNLVLSGSGSLYPIHAGAVCALLELGFQFKSIAATSGGAIIGAAVCAGVGIPRLKRTVIDFNPWRILLRKISNPLRGWGLYDNSLLEGMLTKFFGNISFDQSPIPIHILATQLSPTLQKVIFSKETTPNMSLAKACQISGTIPLLFKVARYEDTPYLDGGLADDLPISIFQSDFANTIAIDIRCRPHKPNTFWQFLRFCFSLIVNERGYWRFSPTNLTLISVDVNHYLTMAQFRLSRKERKHLFDLGYSQVYNYFTNSNNTDQHINKATMT